MWSTNIPFYVWLQAIGLLQCHQTSNIRHTFILDLTPGFNGLGKDICKTKRETLKFWDLVWLILEVWQYMPRISYALPMVSCLAVVGTSALHPYLSGLFYYHWRYKIGSLPMNKSWQRWLNETNTVLEILIQNKKHVFRTYRILLMKLCLAPTYNILQELLVLNWKKYREHTIRKQNITQSSLTRTWWILSEIQHTPKTHQYGCKIGHIFFVHVLKSDPGSANETVVYVE